MSLRLFSASRLSLPTRERGLKSEAFAKLTAAEVVAPYTGAWIEICPDPAAVQISGVAPYTGAWIEIACQ